MAGVLQRFGYCVGARTIKPPGPAFVSRSDSNLDSRGRQLLHRVIAIVRSENPQKIFFCVCVECDEEDDRLALHKSPVKGRLFCGILLKYCGDKERGASSHVWLRGVFDPEQVVSGTRPALNFPPRRLYLQSGGMCIGWVDQGRFPNPTHTTFQVSWRI